MGIGIKTHRNGGGGNSASINVENFELLEQGQFRYGTTTTFDTVIDSKKLYLVCGYDENNSSWVPFTLWAIFHDGKVKRLRGDDSGNVHFSLVDSVFSITIDGVGDTSYWQLWGEA